MTRHIKRCCGVAPLAVCGLVLASVTASVSGQSFGATGSTVIGATIPSATSISTTGCPAAATGFGLATPGIPNVTSEDCAIAFGSSNDTSMLLAYQTDGASTAMHGPATSVADSAFNGGGVSLDTGSETVFIDAVVASDGSVVAVGGNTRAFVARYTTAGMLDPSFAPSASVPGLLPLAVGTSRALAAHLLADGSMILGGDGGGGWVTKVSAAGVVDTSFAPSGVRTLAEFNSIYGITADGQGRILVTGGGSSGEFKVTRLLSTGAIDASYAGDGSADVDIGAGASRAYRLTMAPDGGLVVAGLAGNGSNNDVAFLKLNVRGEPDLAWGVNGVRVVDRGGVEACYDMAAVPAGGYVCAGWGATDPLIVKVTAAGAVDTSFGPASDGAATWAMTGTQILYGISVEDGGSVVAAGYSTSPADMLLVRTSPQGLPAGGFGTGGALLVDTSSGGSDEGSGVAIVDGSVVVAGYGTTAPMGYRLAYLRKFGAARIDDYVAGVNDWDQGTAAFGACLSSAGSGTAAWATGVCGSTDGAHWRRIPRTADASAKVATMTPGSATATFRFGFRPAADQAPGVFEAAITFETRAPTL